MRDLPGREPGENGQILPGGALNARFVEISKTAVVGVEEYIWCMKSTAPKGRVRG